MSKKEVRLATEKDIEEIEKPVEKEADRLPSSTAEPAPNNKNLIKDMYFGTAEKTFQESARDPDSLRKPYNPDDLYCKTGDYTIYEEMEYDDQVSVCMQLKDDMIMGSGFEFTVEDKDHTPIKDDLERAFNEDADRSLDDVLSELLTSQRFGFSLSEKLFKTRDDGTLTFRDLRTRHPNTWLLHTDVHGNVEKYEQIAGRGEPVKINPKSLIHMVNRGRFQNPYGRSDMREAYNAWFVKRHVIRFYSIFLESIASPKPVGKYNVDKYKKEDVQDAFNALKKFQAKSAMMIPDFIDLEFLETTNQGQAFTSGINIFNMFIGRSLLLPDLMGFQGGETKGGAYSLGKEQIGLFARHIQRRRQAIERAVNKHLVWPIVVWNWGVVPHYPKFKLNPISEQDSLEFAKIFYQSVNGGLYKPTVDEINHFRSILKFPQSDEVEILPKAGGSAPMPGQNPFAPDPSANPEDDKGNAGEEEVENDGDGESEIDNEVDDSSKPEENEQDKKKFIAEVYDLPKGDYHKKVDFVAIGNQLDGTEQKISKEMKPLIREILNDLADQILRKKVVEKQKVASVHDIKVKQKHIKAAQKILTRKMMDHYNESKVIAKNELWKVNFSLPLPTGDYVDLIRNQIVDYVGSKWAYDIGAAAQREITNAIIDGRPPSSVVDFVLDRTGDEDHSTIERQAQVAMDRYSRTISAQVLNRSRQDFFDDNEFVVAYQYSAILDGRTSAWCRGLHGKIFRKGKEPVPPIHHNCRSVLIPITGFEEFTADTQAGGQNIDSFIDSALEQTGFSRL